MSWSKPHYDISVTFRACFCDCYIFPEVLKPLNFIAWQSDRIGICQWIAITLLKQIVDVGSDSDIWNRLLIIYRKNKTSNHNVVPSFWIIWSIFNPIKTWLMVYQINFTFCITEITMLPVFPSLPMPEKLQNS